LGNHWLYPEAMGDRNAMIATTTYLTGAQEAHRRGFGGFNAIIGTLKDADIAYCKGGALPPINAVRSTVLHREAPDLNPSHPHNVEEAL
jgi:hypothetical protein